MKKVYIAALSVILIAAMAACGNAASGSQTPPSGGQTSGATETFTGQVMHLFEDSALIGGEDGALYTLGLRELAITGSDGKPTAKEDVKAGYTVDISYNGTVLESWPAQFSGVSGLSITGEGDDLVGLYVQVLGDLWEKDSGLNAGAKAIFLNLASCENLTEAEQTAVRYVLWCDTGVETLPMLSEDELKSQGYMDEKGNMIDCIGMSFIVAECDEDSIAFSAMKGRGPLAAYQFSGCTAELKDGVWSYTIGSEMIS